MARPHVPKFGNWETEENAPYTAYFDKARQGKSGGQPINPNDPEENPAAFSQDMPQVHAPSRTSEPETSPIPVTEAKSKHVQHASGEEGESRHATDSAASHEGRHYRNSIEPRSSDSLSKGGKVSGMSDRSSNQSPLHPHHQVRATNKGGVASPSWERKTPNDSSHGVAPSTPGRSRLRPVDTPDKGATVPRFGDWDESNPSAADGFTHIFDKVKEERQSGSSKVPMISTESPYDYGGGQDSSHDSKSMWSCCFSWSRK